MQLHLELGILAVNTKDSILLAGKHSLGIDIEQLARDTTLGPDKRLRRDRSREAVIIINGALNIDVRRDLCAQKISHPTTQTSTHRKGRRKRTSCCCPEKKKFAPMRPEQDFGTSA